MAPRYDEMTFKVDSDQSLPQERVKHGPIDPAGVVVDAQIALWAVVHSRPHGHFTALPRGLAACSQHVMVLGETRITFVPGRVELSPFGGELQNSSPQCAPMGNGIFDLTKWKTVQT